MTAAMSALDTEAKPAANTGGEWLTVKMRYKHPEAETSKELAQPLKGEVAKELSDDFRFAAAVASFGPTQSRRLHGSH